MCKLSIMFSLVFSFFISACANMNTTAPADNPMEGTAQQGAPSDFEHRN